MAPKETVVIHYKVALPVETWRKAREFPGGSVKGIDRDEYVGLLGDAYLFRCAGSVAGYNNLSMLLQARSAVGGRKAGKGKGRVERDNVPGL